MVVAFEGETALGTRHAHILVHVPTPLKKCSRSMLMRLFPGQFAVNRGNAFLTSRYHKLSDRDRFLMVVSVHCARTSLTEF